jgi:hypothetical protein
MLLRINSLLKNKNQNQMKSQKIITKALHQFEQEAIEEVHVQPSVEADQVSVEFSESTIFVVPQGVEHLRIVAIGASGGSGNGFGVLLNNGGAGGTAVSNIETNPDESLEIFVGVRGQDGSQPKGGEGGSSTSGFEGGAAASGIAGGGGGGGGATGAIRMSGEEILVVAGGGGGGSGVGNGGLIGRGGAGGSFGTNGRGLSPGRVKHGAGTRGGSSPKTSDHGSGGGGGGLYGGGAGSEYNSTSSGGAGGTGTLEQGLSVNGGGTANGRVVISYNLSTKLKNEDETSCGASI